MVFLQKTEILDNQRCEAIVTGEDNNFTKGVILIVYYNSVHEGSKKVAKQLEPGDIIAVTYENYEEQDGAYNIAVEYVDLIKSTE